MNQPADLRVAEVGDSPGTAWCCRLLAATGAEIRKLVPVPERPFDRHARPRTAGRPLPPLLTAESVAGEASRSATALYLDSGKQIETVDWGSAEGADRARSVLADADVIVTPLTTAELRSRGLDHQALSQHRPGLVVAHGTRFGEAGRYRRLVGTDLQALALSGLLSMVGDPDRPPLRLAGRQAEYTLGLSLFSGVMFALHAGGGVVTTSAVRSLAYLDFKSLAYLESEGTALQRGSDRGPIVLRCADGHVGFYYRPAEWETVKQTLAAPALDDPRFATQAARDTHRAALRQAMEQATVGVTRATLYHRAQAAGVPVGAVLTIPELLRDEQYRAREFFEEQDVPGVGPVRMPGVPWGGVGGAPPPHGAAATARADAGPGRRAASGDRQLPDRPLHGLKVLDLSSITAGGRSTQLLADFGAEVIKVEAESRPDPFRHWSEVTGSAELGDLASPPFRVVGRNKRGIAVDLKDPRGHEVCRRLVGWADLVVENFRRGVLDRLGLDFETLRGWNERVVLLSMSSQGSTGPEAGYISFGVTLEALGGLMSITGYDQTTPVWSTPKVNYPDQVVSLLAPGLAAWGVWRSRRTGRGMWIDLSQRETVTALLGEYVAAASVTGATPRAQGNRGLDGLDLVCRCAGQDEWLALSVATDDQWAALCAVIGRPDLRDAAEFATVPARAGQADRVAELVQLWTRHHDKREAMWQLQDRGIPAAAVLRAGELAAEDGQRGESFQVRVPLPDGAGAEAQSGWPFHLWPGGPPTNLHRAPRLGEHTRDVLVELGYPPDEIDALLAAGVVATAESKSESR